MSQPRDPYRGQQPRPYQQQPYGQQPQPYGQQQPYRQQPSPYAPQRPYAERRPPAQYEPPPPPVRAPRRIPGLGLVLTGVSLVVQVLSLTLLPWVSSSGPRPASSSMLDLWKVANEFGTHGFGAWYVVLFSYPLAALGILLTLAAVLDSVAMKVIWCGLTLLGLGILVLRFGLGPFAEVVVGGHPLEFTRQEITTAVIAIAALVAVIFMLKTAMGMFRRVAGLILLGLAGVHVAAVVDLVKGAGIEQLSFGAYGPVLGYVLGAVATVVRR